MSHRFTILLGLLVLTAPASAQDEPEPSSTPEPEVASPEPEVAAPEPEVATPEPEVATPVEHAEPDPEPQPSLQVPESAEEVEAPHPAGPQFTFANSFFTWSNGATLHTFAPGAQLSYNPTYQMSFAVMPRFYLTDTTFLLLNQSIGVELTDSDSGTYNREPLLGDTLLDLRQIVQWEGFVFQGMARLGFPLSKASQAAGRILQTGLGITVARPIPEAAGLTVAATFGYRRWWATRNVASAEERYAGNCFQPEPGQPPVCSQAGGNTTARDILIAGLTLNVAPLPGFTISASGFYMTAYGHEIGDADIDINGGSVNLADDSPTHWRPYTYFSLAVAYDVVPWLNLQLGVQNAAVVSPLYNPDGSVRSPFSADTQVFLTTTVGLDSLYGEIFGGGEDDGLTPEERQRRRQGLASTGGRSAF